MSLTGALVAVLSLVATGGEERTLLCRPRVAGDPALARAEVVATAARAVGARLLDYGVACEDAAEASRAARRAGLGHAVSGTAEGRPEGSRFVLVLSDAATDAERSRRSIEVAPGADAVAPVKGALRELLKALPPPPGPRPAHVAAWSLAGAGAAALIVGAVFTLQARDAAGRANRATDLGAHLAARRDWETKRRNAGLAFGAGGAAVAAGLTWRFAF